MDLNATILGQLISFILFVWLCMQYIWPKIIDIIEHRKQEIIKSVSDLEKIKQNIKLAKLKSINIILESKKQANLIIQNADKNKLLILEQAKINAMKEKKRIIKLAISEINIKKIKLKNKLIKQTTNLAIDIANKIIKNSFEYQKSDNQLLNRLINDI